MLVLLLIGFTSAFPCSTISFEPCYFEYMHCTYKYSVYTNYHTNIYNLLEYKVIINGTTIENYGIYIDVTLATFIYNSEYPECKLINLINVTLPCIICPDADPVIITNTNYGNILENSITYLIIILSSCFGGCILIVAGIIMCVYFRQQGLYKPLN